jgi:hypothetical protein
MDLRALPAMPGTVGAMLLSSTTLNSDDERQESGGAVREVAHQRTKDAPNAALAICKVI